MAETAIARPCHPAHLDDEIIALSMQMEEIGLYSKQSKGKHAVDSPPDLEVAFQSFQSELEAYKTFLDDQKLALSIGSAVHADSAIIAEITSSDLQAHEDRRVALELSRADPELQSAPHNLPTTLDNHVKSWMSTVSGSIAAASIIDFSDDEYQAGPSTSFAERQATAMEKLAQSAICVACQDKKPATSMISAGCEHFYCVNCVKTLFKRAAKDETLFPPRCCKNPISPELVTKHMTADEAAAFELASIEFTTIDRVYCSNRSCGKFIRSTSVDPGINRAVCDDCGHTTCSLCKNEYHKDRDCPADPSLLQTRELANAMRWQTCYQCNSVVMLRTGCNHMTCRCKAQFCYVCGIPWKNCKCSHADADRMYERAEEVVDRDPRFQMPGIARQQRIRRVQAELDNNHECTHPGKFQRISDGPRRGFRCEMCDARHWKFILQCRHCYLNVCQDCRCNRI